MKMQSSKMNHFPPPLTIVAVLFLTLSPFESTLAQKSLSYLERFNLASEIVSQMKPDATSHLANLEEVHIVQELLTLSSAQLQGAVLQSARSLASGTAGDRSGFQELWTEGIQAGQNVSELCLNHTEAIVVGLLARSGWALQMLDAFGKPTPGVLDGNFIWLGGYKQCFKVRANTTVTSHPYFSGQYCTARIPMSVAVSSVPMQMSLGICVPDTCSGADLTSLIHRVLSSLNITLGMTVFVDCAEQSIPLDARAIVAIVICSLFLFFIVVGTALDLLFIQMPKWQMEKMMHASTSILHHKLDENALLLGKPDVAVRRPEMGISIKVFLAFSVYTNGSKLLSTNQPSSSLTCIHGIRFLSMTWVVLGHSYIFPLSVAANFGPYIQEVMKRWTFQPIANATVSVDTFFVLSGLLVAYLSLKEMKKNSGKINWFLFYFHRFWRLTPVYMLVIMVYLCLSPYWGEGPLWPSTNADRDNCKDSWWTNLLYINNLVKADKMCLVQSWYLSNDMQFYILSPLIFVPFYFSRLFGLISSIVFLLVTAIVPATLTVRDHFPPGILPGELEGNNTNMADFMVDFYMKPYNRMGPYIVGMLAGYFLYHTDCKLRINKMVNLSAWAVATGSALAVLYGLYDASNGHPVTLSVSAFYNAVSRQVWGACVAWVAVACITGNGGFVNTILSWSAFVPLSRLTYCIYLLHIMIMELYLLNSNTVFYMSDLNFVMLFLGILVVSYMAAAVTSLAFEAPMIGLERLMFRRDKKGDDKEPK